jgi:hypothetical protein
MAQMLVFPKDCLLVQMLERLLV